MESQSGEFERRCLFCDGTDRVFEKICTTVEQIRYVCAHCDNPAQTENVHAIVRVAIQGHDPLIFHVVSDASYAFEKFVAAVYRIKLPFAGIDATRTSITEFYAISRTMQIIGLLGYDSRIPKNVHIKQMPAPVIFPHDINRAGSAMRSSQTSITPCTLIDVFLNFTE